MKSFQPKKVLADFISLSLIPLFIVTGNSQASSEPDTSKSTTNNSTVLRKVSAVQIPFIENKGQIKNGAVKYYAKTMGGTVFVTETGELVYSLPKAEEGKDRKGWSIKERFVGGKTIQAAGEEQAVTKVSYFRGKDPKKWQHDIATYNLVSLGEVYKGIEVKLKAYGNNIEKLLYVKPKADPKSICLNIDGAKGLKVTDAGELEVSTDIGAVRFTKPVAFQEVNGKKDYVEVSYVTKDSGYGFKVGTYDRSNELVIDPLLASTLLGVEQPG